LALPTSLREFEELYTLTPADREFIATHENQRHRACGLNLVVAAIVLWNTVSLERAVAALREGGQAVSDETLAHLWPLKWEHINLTGDYHWRKDAGLGNRRLRPLRLPTKPVPGGP